MTQNTPAPADLVEAVRCAIMLAQQNPKPGELGAQMAQAAITTHQAHMASDGVVQGDRIAALDWRHIEISSDEDVEDLAKDFAAHRRAAATGKADDLLRAMLAAQKVQPYNGWSITELNKAADAAREHLGLPSIRDQNPDIAAMQDAMRANQPALQALIPTPQLDPRDAEIVGLRSALRSEKMFHQAAIYRIEYLDGVVAELREALDWALNEIRSSTRYDNEQQFWNAYDHARTALAKEGK